MFDKKAYMKAWKLKNKEQVTAYNKDWWVHNKDERNKRREENRRIYNRTRRKELTHDKDYYYRSSYGITLVEYESMFQAQNGLCAICKNPENKVNRGKVMSLAVDHCHQTHKVRGLLCFDCNTALGKLKEDETIINSLLNYIKKQKQE